jgi:toxin ParE1/3/4
LSAYVLSPRAQTDLEEIWDYTEERWGERQAREYVRQLQRAIETVAADPGRGRPCDDVRRGYRKYSVGAHVIFFLPEASRIAVIRVLHQRMDFDRHL